LFHMVRDDCGEIIEAVKSGFPQTTWSVLGG